MEIHMRKPEDETVGALVDLLDDDLTEMFHERAGFRHYLGEYPAAHAEALALLDVINRHPDALSGVTAFAFEIDGATHWVITTDQDLCRDHVTRTGGTARRADISRVVRDEFGGVAEITTAA
jgi:hypothetical protein